MLERNRRPSVDPAGNGAGLAAPDAGQPTGLVDPDLRPGAKFRDDLARSRFGATEGVEDRLERLAVLDRDPSGRSGRLCWSRRRWRRRRTWRRRVGGRPLLPGEDLGRKFIAVRGESNPHVPGAGLRPADLVGIRSGKRTATRTWPPLPRARKEGAHARRSVMHCRMSPRIAATKNPPCPSRRSTVAPRGSSNRMVTAPLTRARPATTCVAVPSKRVGPAPMSPATSRRAASSGLTQYPRPSRPNESQGRSATRQ